MKDNHDIDWSKPQRQSASALVILLYKALVDILRFAWPLLLLMVIRKKSGAVNSYELIALGISIFSLSRSAIEYFTFRFSIINNELVIKKGFFIKKNIVMPLEKIQAVHAEQPWIHNLFKVSRVSFDSAGSEKMEVKIEALDSYRTTALKDIILGSKEMGIATGEKQQLPYEETLISLSANDLAKLSLSANHLEAFLLLLTFIYSSAQSIGVSDNEYTGVLKWVDSMVQSDTFKLLLLLIAFALIVSVGISVIRVLLVYASFIITRSEKGYRIRTGLINKKEKFIPFKKIQFITWKANWIRQKINLFLLQFHATATDQSENKMEVKVPVTRKSFIPILLANYHPLLPVQEMEALRVHPKYVTRRVLIFGILPCIICLPILYYYIQTKALFILIFAFLIWLGCWLFQRKFRLWAGEEALQIKRGFFGSYEGLLKWNKIQSVRLDQSIYQRRHQLATVELKTAGGTITIPYITVAEARQIQNYCLYKIESSSEAWA